MTSPSTSSGRGYDGGKGGAGVAQWIINQIPPHATYIEAFLGAGAVLCAKRPAERNIGIERDPAVIAAHWAYPGCNVVCGDALIVLGQLAISGDTFLYCDPPYLMETRTQQRPLYRNEFATIEEHRALLTLLRKLPCMIAISGYWSALYELELAGWRTSTFTTIKRSGAAAEEWLWMNYGPPLELHDYRYLGRNFRERERIKRKKARWTKRLRTMPELERLCLIEAIGELRASIGKDSDRARAGIATNGDIDDRDPIVIPGEQGLRQGASLDLAMAAGIAGNDDRIRRATPEITVLELQL